MAFGLDPSQLIFVIILILIPVLYELNGTFRFYVKMTLYYVLVNVAAVYVIVVSLWRPFDVENYSYVVMIIKEIRRLFALEIEIRGAEHLETNEPCVVVANHQTSLDFFGMMEVWPSRCAALAKRSLQYMFPFGLAATLTGTVFVDRGQKDRSVTTMNEAAKTIKEKNVKVFVFPEGTRNRDGSMKPFKKGAFHLAVQAQVPVLPVVFSSYTSFYSKKDRRWEPGKLVITVLPKISTEGVTADDVPTFTNRIRDQMLEAFDSMSANKTETAQE